MRPAAIDGLVQRIRRLDWNAFLRPAQDEDRPAIPGTPAPQPRTQELGPTLQRLLDATLEMHTLIADSFLNHQARITQVTQPALAGF